MVTVFNHDSWSGRIKHLVDEVLEIERRLTARPLADSPYHFDLHNLDYTRKEEGVGVRYQFNMLTPRDFAAFSQKLREQALVDYRSQLDAKMLDEGE